MKSRRQRRPPNKREREAIAFFSVCVIIVLAEIFVFARAWSSTWGVINLACAILVMFCARVWLPGALDYLKNGFMDD